MSYALARRVYRIAGRPVDGGRVAGAVLALLGSIAAGGCALKMPTAARVVEADVTGSVAAAPSSPLGAELGPEDWRRAKAALAVALDPQGNGAAVAWDNPDTALKGSFSPVGGPFVKDDLVCRAFLASVSGQDLAKSLQGSACRPSGGEWLVQDVKPWRKPA